MRPLSHDEVLDVAVDLAPRLAERADDAERDRRLQDRTIAEAEVLFPMVVPKALGGYGLDIGTLAHSTRLLGRGCPSAAWTISFFVIHSWLLSRFPDPTRSDLLTRERPWALTPAPLAPTGRLEPVDGGYRLSGRWEWATGVWHGEWVMVNAMEDSPAPAPRFAVVPRDDVEVDDVWFTSGMCSTGSNNIRITDLFVPTGRTIPTVDLMGQRSGGLGLDRLPVACVLSLTAAAPALGAAEAAVELFRARIGERILAFSPGDRQAEQPASQIRLATAISELAGARARWDRTIEGLATVEGLVTDGQRANARLVAAATVRDARSVIRAVCDGSGASIYFGDSPLQRLQRDVEVLKGHVVFDWDRAAELAGRVALGNPLRPTDLA